MALKKRYIVLIVLLCLALGLGVLFGPGVYRTVRLYRMAEEFLSRQAQSMDVAVMTEGNSNVEFRLDWQDWEGKRIFTLESGGETVHYCDGVLYLKNGKGYRFSEAIPDLTPVLEQPWLLIPLVELQREEDLWLLSVKTEGLLPESRSLNVTVRESEGMIHALRVNTWGQNMGDFLGFSGVVQTERPVLDVPQAVRDSIQNGAVQGDKDLTQDILRLVKGWMLLNNRDPLGMEADIRVDLLDLPLNTQLTLYTTNAYTKPIHYLHKDGVGIWFTDGAACTPEGVRIGSPEMSVDVTKLLGFAYYLCFNGELACEADCYRLELDRQGMEQVLYTIAPETKDMALTLMAGTLELHMQGDVIASISIAVSGQVDLVIAQVDISTQVNMEIIQEDFELTIPQNVLDTLLE